MQQINSSIFQRKQQFHVKIRSQRVNNIRKQARSYQSNYIEYQAALKELLNKNPITTIQTLLKIKSLLHSVPVKQRNTWMESCYTSEFIQFLKQILLINMDRQQQTTEQLKIKYEIVANIIFILSQNPSYLSSVGLLSQQMLQALIFECLKQFDDQGNLFFGCLNFCGNILQYQDMQDTQNKCLEILGRINIQQMLYLIMHDNIQSNQFPLYYSQLLWFGHSFVKLLRKTKIYCQYHKFLPQLVSYAIWIYDHISQNYAKEEQLNTQTFKETDDIFGILFYTNFRQPQTLLKWFYKQPYKNLYNYCLNHTILIQKQSLGSVLQFTLHAAKNSHLITLNCYEQQTLACLIVQLAKQKPSQVVSQKCIMVLKIINYMIMNEVIEDRSKTVNKICSILETLTLAERQSIFMHKIHLNSYSQFARLLSLYVQHDCQWLNDIFEKCIQS